MRNMFNITVELEAKEDMLKLADILLRAGYQVYYGEDEEVVFEIPSFSVYQVISNSEITKFDKDVI